MSLLSRLQRANQEKPVRDTPAPSQEKPTSSVSADKAGEPKTKKAVEPKTKKEKPAAKKEQKKQQNPSPPKDPHAGLKASVHKKLIEKVEKLEGSRSLQEEIHGIATEILDQEVTFLPKGEREKILQEIVAEAVGYGPIHPLLADHTVSEIMVNGPEKVYVERDGKLQQTDIVFRDDAHVLHIIEKIVAPLGRRIDESQPMVDARLPDGSRVNAIITPLALNGPTLTIRKFSEVPFTIDDLLEFETLSPEMAEFLEAAVKGRLNAIVSGGTGSGKTSTLNVLSSFIGGSERIVTIEDAAEIKLCQEHVVTLEARLPNTEGKGGVSIRDLVRNALRMRPDRIVVGEVRSGEALDMLQAMNTGHDGSLTTGHANSPRDILSRLETMVMMAGMELPVRAIREQIASAIDLVIHQSRMKDGSRKVTHITEIQGMEGDVIVMQDLFVFQQEGINEEGKVMGRFRPTGIRPKFMPQLEVSGLNLGPEIFADSF